MKPGDRKRAGVHDDILGAGHPDVETMRRMAYEGRVLVGLAGYPDVEMMRRMAYEGCFFGWLGLGCPYSSSLAKSY